MKYKVSPKRADFLREKFFEYSFKNIELDVKELESITEPIELDFIVKNHNYDDGNEILIYILNNSNCDLSTVKMLFSRADVEGYLNDIEKCFDRDLLNVLKQNCENNFYKSEKFYYNPIEDTNALDFEVDIAKKVFPLILFTKPKGKKIEPTFAEFISRRSLSFMKRKVEIIKKSDQVKFSSENLRFEYNFPVNFISVSDLSINQFFNKLQFPEYLKKLYAVSESQLKKVIVKPEIVISNDEITIGLFVFNSEPLYLVGSITNAATILRNEFSYIQAFFKIIEVEENFEKVKRIKKFDTWSALSKMMKIKFENLQFETYLRIYLIEKDGGLFYFFASSLVPTNLADDILENLIINRFEIHQDYR